MDCPYCDKEASRMIIHNHLIEKHKSKINQDGEYDYKCPECNKTTKLETPKGSENFSEDIVLLAFDILLNHLEEEHDY